jgi:stigma-specific protein Stig1
LLVHDGGTPMKHAREIARVLIILALPGCGGRSLEPRDSVWHVQDQIGDPACPPGQILCAGECTDVATNADDCGGCGRSCEAGVQCHSGVCGGEDRCPTGMVDCDGECRDLSGDPEQCGGCVHAVCGSHEACVDGVCACRPGLTECGGAGCVDTRTDPAHCGACDTPCSGTCVAGSCAQQCTGEGNVADCDGACVDLDQDPLDCGECGRTCSRDQVCIGGECWDYEPAVGCDSCATCDVCPGPETCCELPGYGVSCVDTNWPCPAVQP